MGYLDPVLIAANILAVGALIGVAAGYAYWANVRRWANQLRRNGEDEQPASVPDDEGELP